jgi:hypothetical protein
MSAGWHYAENGSVTGPVSAVEIRKRILLATGLPHFVWRAGMPDWVEARNVAEFADVFVVGAASPRDGAAGWKRMVVAPAKRAELARRARHELYEFLAIAAYLWVCFGALVVYKATVLRSVGVEFAPFGLAVVKALISAKFIMLLEAFKLGGRGKREGFPFVVILRKSSVFTLFLIVLTVIEELIVGHLHGKERGEILAEMAGGTLPQALSVGLLIFLIMIPYFAYREAGVSLWKASES